MFDEVSLPWDWPVLVNYHEAKAFATWKTLTEEQVRPTSAALGNRLTEPPLLFDSFCSLSLKTAPVKGADHLSGKITQIRISDSRGQWSR